MAEPVTLMNFRDNYVQASQPNRVYSSKSRLKLAASSFESFMFWGRPQPLHSTVQPSVLRVWNAEAWTGTVTLTAQLLTASWSAGRLKWNNKPASTATNQAVVSKTNAAKNTLWEFDITAMMQQVANGTAWYGIRITASGSTVRNIYSSQGEIQQYRPRVVIQWSDAPDQPENLVPNNNFSVSKPLPTLDYDFIDVSGDVTQAYQQVQLATDQNFTQIVFDSGKVATTVSQMDLTLYLGTNPTANVMVNPTVDTNATGYAASINCSVARVTTPTHAGAGALGITATAAGSAVAIGNLVAVTPGQQSVMSTWVRSAATARQFAAVAYYYDASLTNIGTATVIGTAVTTSTTAWTQATVTGLAPSNAAYVTIGYYLPVAAASEVHYIDDSSIVNSFGGVANGSSYWWRVMAWDGAGLPSPWSDPEQFKRTDKGTLTVTALAGPDGSGNYSVADSSPPVVWSLTGVTQKKYQVIISTVATPDVFIFNTGVVTGTATSIDTGSAKDKILTNKTTAYLLTVRVWDTIDRQKTPGDPIYYEYRQSFYYKPSNSVESPVLANLYPDYPYPGITLEFTRSAPPDFFAIYRDGEIVLDNIDPGDVLYGTNIYRFDDLLAPPRVLHSWTVVAKVNNVASLDSNAMTYTPHPQVTWLMETDGSNPVCLVKSSSEKDPIVDASSQTTQSTFQPVGGSPPVLITQFISGYEGHASGVFADNVVAGLSARQMRDIFKGWIRNPGKELLLYMVDEVMTVVPYNMIYRPRAKSGQVLYDVEFDFYQVDY